MLVRKKLKLNLNQHHQLALWSIILSVISVMFTATTVQAAVVDYQTAIQADPSLAYYYNFDGANNTARLADKKGGADLSAVADLPTLGAAGFDATSDSADFSTSSVQRLVSVAGSVDLDDVSMTVEMIVRIDASGDSYIFNAKEASGGNRTLLGLTGFGKGDAFAFAGAGDFGGQSGAEFIDTGALVADRWYFMAATFTNSGVGPVTTIQTYVADLTAGDGLSAVASVTYTGRYEPAATELYVGGPWFGHAPFDFDGATDELAIFDGALSEAAIAEHLSAIYVPEPTSMILLGMGVVGLIAFGRRCKK